MKERVTNELREALGRGRASVVARDPHARRKPRPCGITIHPGHGCPLMCAYCYIYDMGFGTVARPYPLNGEELAYALARNPYVVPERTLAAFGSVTEPLLPVLRPRTLEYVSAVARWLRLPIQLSTKLLIDEEFVESVRSADPGASVLVSVTGLRYWRKLEPRAPDPLLRIRAASVATRKGLRADLFLRPIIPGIINEDELRKLFFAAKDAGFSGVVAGSLRVTEGILKRLRNAGIPLAGLDNALRRIKPGSRQVPVPDPVTKNMARTIAAEAGLEYLPSACAANIRSHGMGCALCKYGPCGAPPRPDISDIEEFLEVAGLRGHATLAGEGIKVVIRGRRRGGEEVVRVFLSEVYKRRVIVRFA